MAAKIAYADGNIARKELLKIQSWAQKTADSCSYDDSTKNKMKIRIRQAFKDATESKIITNEECKKFKSFAPTTENQIDLIDICLDVMTADGDVHESEEREIALIVNYLNFDLDLFEEIRKHKKLKSRPKPKPKSKPKPKPKRKPKSRKTSSTDIPYKDSDIGIKSSWTLAKKQQYIKSQFRENIALSTHQNADKREEANCKSFLGKLVKIFLNVNPFQLADSVRYIDDTRFKLRTKKDILIILKMILL